MTPNTCIVLALDVLGGITEGEATPEAHRCVRQHLRG